MPFEVRNTAKAPAISSIIRKKLTQLARRNARLTEFDVVKGPILDVRLYVLQTEDKQPHFGCVHVLSCFNEWIRLADLPVQQSHKNRPFLLFYIQYRSVSYMCQYYVVVCPAAWAKSVGKWAKSVGKWAKSVGIKWRKWAKSVGKWAKSVGIK